MGIKFDPFKFIVGALITTVGFATGQPWLVEIGVMTARGSLRSLSAQSHAFSQSTIDPSNAVPITYGKARVA